MGMIGFSWKKATPLDRAILILSSFFLVGAASLSDAIGLALLAAVLLKQRYWKGASW